MAGRHRHNFAPAGGLQFGNERMEQFCECGARRCVGESARGFGGSFGGQRCRSAAIPGERHCKRHKERKRGADWVEDKQNARPSA